VDEVEVDIIQLQLGEGVGEGFFDTDAGRHTGLCSDEKLLSWHSGFLDGLA
jgi:hypothetical protein